jgi:rubrerythrin
MSENADLVLAAMITTKRSLRAVTIISDTAPCLTDRELLATILREERRHYYLLEGVYEDIVNQPPQINPASVSLPKDYIEMLKTCICDKLAAVEQFEDLPEKINCARHNELMQIIIRDQKEHTRILAGIYNRNA